MNTIIQYHYQDAANYKSHSEDDILEGTLTEKEKTALLDKFQQEGFVPSQIGLNDLQGELQQYDQSSFNDDDHCFHQLDAVEATQAEPNHSMTAKEFYNKMMTTNWVIS
jgi:hypothetical protein